MSAPRCPQCLLPNQTDCQERDCPGTLEPAPPEGGVEMDAATMRLFLTMGLRTLALEKLVVRAADWMNGTFDHDHDLPADLMHEAGQIRMNRPPPPL